MVSFKPKSYVCKWCGKQHYRGSKVSRQHQKLLKKYGFKKEKYPFIYYKIQCKSSKNAKWETPKLREYGTPVSNRFKTKLQAKKWYWKYGMYSYKKPLYAIRFKAFTNKKRK